MFDLLVQKTPKFLQEIDLDDAFTKIKAIFGYQDVSDDRREYLSAMIEDYGYLPYPQFQVLDELTPGEIIYTLEKQLIKEGVYDGKKFTKFKNPSPLARYNIKNSSWFKREGHNIKLVSLAGLGKGESKETGKFLDWVAQLIILPMGNRQEGVLPATLYLIPFHPREFECAYLPQSSEVSPNIADEKISKFLGLQATEQVNLFITLAQLTGHPVIYDILPQTSRFAKIVLAKPWIARWFDINELMDKYCDSIVFECNKLMSEGEISENDVSKMRETYSKILNAVRKDFSVLQKKIFKKIAPELEKHKMTSSREMTYKEKQEEIVLKVQKIIEEVNGFLPKCEEDITNQQAIIKELIKQGFWPAPGGAWCSCNVPVFEKMSENQEYPIFKHYNFKGEDVTKFANLDCQTPFYFAYFEKNKFNNRVVDFFIEYMENLQKKFNFDGFRVDHIDHVVDEISEQNGFPISYRAPSKVLGKLNKTMKSNIPYFATLAEYMLWDKFYFEYHRDMSFDLLWGNDIISQNSKTPKVIFEDNEELSEYNKKNGQNSKLSIIKTYNNQDGEFREIDQYPGQLGEAGALFKWFKYKFIPGGEYAQRPVMYADGDESFTKGGIERIIGKETSMIRNKNWFFFEKFDAINRFTENCPLILNGKARLILQEDDGIAAWKITQKNNDRSLLVVVNYMAPTERTEEIKPDGTSKRIIKKGQAVRNKVIPLEMNETIISYYDFDYDKNQKAVFVPKPLIDKIYCSINFEILQPSEFKVYEVIKEHN